MQTNSYTNTKSKGFLFYLLLTALLCGALIMVIEVLGSRVIGPFFGVSLFVWTSLITVTLIALACGYAAGGYFSDRYSSASYLFIIIFIASLFVLLIPILKLSILKMAVPLGLRGGSFVATLILFGPSLFLLGCVSPYLVKVIATEMDNIGRVTGGLYALSTVGSTIGTLLTGFVLIAYLGVDEIFYLVGSLLLILSVMYFVIFRRFWLALAAVILLYPLHYSSEFTQQTMPDGTQVTKIYQIENYYGDIKVMDYRFQDVHVRELMIDGLVQGGLDMNNHLSIFDYSYHMQYLSYMANPTGKNCLVFGLGTGAIPRWFAGKGVTCDVVDINPDVFNIAKTYFNYTPNGESVVEDARYFLNRSNKKYDYIVLDVFNGDITPAHLLSVEALQLVKSRIASNGVLAINLIGSLKRNNFMTASVIATIEQVFNDVAIYPNFYLNKTKGVGNITLLASPDSKLTLNSAVISQPIIHPRFAERVRTLLAQQFRLPANTKSMILTDEYNPIDFYDGWLRESIRQRILNSTNWDVLIS